jgi:hypothetical protein
MRAVPPTISFARPGPSNASCRKNLLFPTCIYHQIDKGFTPHELPHAEVFRLDSEEVYKANLDRDALRDCGAGGANARVVVESVELPTIEPTCSACTT